ncbi:pectin lyase fold/virulence factor [Ostreococcus tauri]|uniref:Pectin lyase fold/virulence factor n=1 Tax=Ostreococcus tauri TaxID=70448 RepID=A0A1Y5I0X7_OSTTA|nr:pectin lyase fold/virulence factor [Ostreococcus tauri]
MARARRLGVALVAVLARALARARAFDARTLARALDASAVPEGGLDARAWYALAAGVGGTSRASASDARALARALRDDAIGTIDVTASFALDDGADDGWPTEGVMIRRAVTLRGTCDGRCAIDGNGTKAFLSVGDGGSLVMREMRTRGGEVDGCEFAECDAAAGGGVFVASGDGAGRVTFRNVTFTKNRATGSPPARGGGAFVTSTSAKVIFESCAFAENVAENGIGGGVYGRGGHVIVNGCSFRANVAASGGGVAFEGGGVVSSSAFLANVATKRSGGGAHVVAETDVVGATVSAAVQRSSFVNNSAVSAGGGVFVYGRVRMLANSFSTNALDVSAPAGLNPNYYVCTNSSATGCSMAPTLANYIYDPAQYDPFEQQSSFAAVT